MDIVRNISTGEASASFNESSLNIAITTLAGRIITIFFYTAAIFLTATGNLIVIIVFATGRRSNTDIRNYLINLSVFDLLIGIFCLPFTFTQIYTNYWPFPSFMCTVVLYIQLVSVTGSVITNMAIGVDRLWVVKYPLRSRVTKSRTRIVIVVIWLISLCMSSVQFWISRTDNSGQCLEDWNDNVAYQRAYTIFLVILTYLLPLTILSYTYCTVALNLWRRNLPGIVNEVRDFQQLRSKMRVIKMLTIIVVLFGVCWLPLHVTFLLMDFGKLNKTQRDVLFLVSHWLAMANSFVNPFIYSFMHDSFRRDLQRLLARIFPCYTFHEPLSTRSTLRRDDHKFSHNGLRGTANAATAITAAVLATARRPRPEEVALMPPREETKAPEKKEVPQYVTQV